MKANILLLAGVSAVAFTFLVSSNQAGAVTVHNDDKVTICHYPAHDGDFLIQAGSYHDRNHNCPSRWVNEISCRGAVRGHLGGNANLECTNKASKPEKPKPKPKRKPQPYVYVTYAAKFVCGDGSSQTSVAEGSQQAVQGQYRTTINIYNTDAKFAMVLNKRAIQLLPQSGRPRAPSSPEKVSLQPMQGEGIDCNDIRRLLEKDGYPVEASWFEGMLDIRMRARAPLRIMPKVTAVYTASPLLGSSGEESVFSIDVEEIQPSSRH